MCGREGSQGVAAAGCSVHRSGNGRAAHIGGSVTCSQARGQVLSLGQLSKVPADIPVQAVGVGTSGMQWRWQDCHASRVCVEAGGTDSGVASRV